MIEELKYTSRLGDIFLFVGNLLKHGLNSSKVLEMTDGLCNGIEDVFNDPKIFPKEVNKEEKEKMLKKMFINNLRIVSSYKFWVLNHGWLMMCAVFEDFLKDSLNEVLLKNNNLCVWDTREEIIMKYSSKKTNEGIIYFLKKLKISEKELFDLSFFKKEIQEKYKDMGVESIIEIFKKRHDIAHSDKLVVKSVEEFEDAKELFDKLFILLPFQLNKKWGVETQMSNMRKNINNI